MDLFNSKYILSNKRFGWIDYDRGISIILVTYRHCFEGLERAGIDFKSFPVFEYINVFFFGFRMPLFFIASGIFISSSMRKKGYGNYAYNRIQTILYPLLIWGIIQISLQMLFSDHTNSDVTPDYYWYLLAEPRITGQFWYLNALFFVGIIYATLREFLKFKKMHQLLLGLTMYFFAWYLREQALNWGFAMDIFKYYMFFAIGDMISEWILTEGAAKIFTSWKIVLPLFISFITIQYFFTEINMKAGDNYHVENHMPFLFILVALVGCSISICASFSLKKHASMKFLRVVGYNSVHIYCMQVIIMAAARVVLVKAGIIYPPLLLPLVLISGIVFPMIAYNVALRFNMWWLFTLKKPVEEIAYLSDKKESNKV